MFFNFLKLGKCAKLCVSSGRPLSMSSADSELTMCVISFCGSKPKVELMELLSDKVDGLEIDDVKICDLPARLAPKLPKRGVSEVSDRHLTKARIGFSAFESMVAGVFEVV